MMILKGTGGVKVGDPINEFEMRKARYVVLKEGKVLLLPLFYSFKNAVSGRGDIVSTGYVTLHTTAATGTTVCCQECEEPKYKARIEEDQRMIKKWLKS